MTRFSLIGLLIGLMAFASNVGAGEKSGIYFERDKVYDVTYQTNRYETKTIHAVQILTPRKFGNGLFLILKKDRFGGGGKYAYLRLDHIVMIAESGFDPGVKNMTIQNKGKRR